MWLYGPNNMVMLSVPLAGGRNVKGSVDGIRIAWSEPWQRVHWRTLHDCYRKSPWFEVYEPDLARLYQQQPDLLCEWNRMCMEWAFRMIGINTVISSVYAPETLEHTEIALERNPIPVPPKPHPHYLQVFAERRGFVANLCILDLLFNEGPRAADYIDRLAAYINSSTNGDSHG